MFSLEENKLGKNRHIAAGEWVHCYGIKNIRNSRALRRFVKIRKFDFIYTGQN